MLEREETPPLRSGQVAPQQRPGIGGCRVPPNRAQGDRNSGKELVLVDKRGVPHGKNVQYLQDDMRSFAKALNPCYSWADMPLDEKQLFFERLYAGNHVLEDIAWNVLSVHVCM